MQPEEIRPNVYPKTVTILKASDLAPCEWPQEWPCQNLGLKPLSGSEQIMVCQPHLNWWCIDHDRWD